MSEQTVSFIKGRHGDIAVHDWGNDKPHYLALLVHGYGEHLGRYQYVARTLQAIERDPEAARAVGRPPVDTPYLHLRNYTNNLKRLGWTDADIADGGSDALIDALVAHGDAASVRKQVDEHLTAGADHVTIQVLGSETPSVQLAEILGA